VIALFFMIVVVGVALTVGRTLGRAEAFLQQVPGAAASGMDR
jgi:hypothetical protein